MSGSAKVALPRPPWRCYAIGDIHGRLDLLARLLDLIRSDYRAGGAAPAELVFLGDYIDRGPDSAGVLDLLAAMAARPSPGLRPVFLKGNHEDLMLDFLAGGPRALAWLHNGGLATLASYGVAVPEDPDGAGLAAAAAALAAALPAGHRGFLERLAPHHVAGPYLFVHAGLRPGIPLAAQDEQDLLWIRGPFLGATERFEKFIVHGHTISAAPELRSNRLGIDTGAFCTGCLTAAVLDRTGVRFLDTA
jgi:serine/threonine protein phosphatase 1